MWWRVEVEQEIWAAAVAARVDLERERVRLLRQAPTTRLPLEAAGQGRL